ncbi:MAG: hypothetical protein JOZ81_05780 [Chloroflexi bacterium]|nr:hypothetical protein [Chloroflexota bacterium]
MVEGVHLEAVVLVPRAGPALERGDLLAILARGQPLAQQLGGEVVVAVPAPLPVERDEEQVGAFELGQHVRSGHGRVSEHRVAERPTQALEDGRPQQEGFDGGRLALENLFDQVVQHEVMPAGERRDEAGDVVLVL